MVHGVDTSLPWELHLFWTAGQCFGWLFFWVFGFVAWSPNKGDQGETFIFLRTYELFFLCMCSTIRDETDRFPHLPLTALISFFHLLFSDFLQFFDEFWRCIHIFSTMPLTFLSQFFKGWLETVLIFTCFQLPHLFYDFLAVNGSVLCSLTFFCLHIQGDCAYWCISLFTWPFFSRAGYQFIASFACLFLFYAVYFQAIFQRPSVLRQQG